MPGCKSCADAVRADLAECDHIGIFDFKASHT